MTATARTNATEPPARRRPGRPPCARPAAGVARPIFMRELHALVRAGVADVDRLVRVDAEARLWRPGEDVRGLVALHGLLPEEAARVREVLERVWERRSR
jgi:hypothetical protein